MTRSYRTLTLDGAQRMLSAAEAKAAGFKVAYNIAVVGPLYGIQESNAGKVVIFGGGIPIVLEGQIVGAVGASAGTVEQDIAVVEAAAAALAPS